jgi:hypothetical protein
MKRKEENRSVIEPSCTFFIPNKINCLPSNRVLDRKPDRVTGYKVLIDLTSLIKMFDRDSFESIVLKFSQHMFLFKCDYNL